ncbi:MAG TPA: hypothetical protein DD381_06635 [Lentisphaeria bacterium]|nr:MAG: hypothetical protein A2X47_13145 [Lentisphaerae bacterium GWF2_38_69]HBM16002.1 hypothetical protein [Lentisphaeria bacterium]
MKRIIISIFAVMALSSTNLFAGFQGPGTRKDLNTTTVAEARNSPEDTKVIIKGNITESIKDELYVFKDKTGEINVKIDNDKLKNITVTPEISITIYGEVDNDSDLGGIGIDVDKIQLDSTPVAASVKSTASIQPPSGAEEVVTGTDRGCTYTRYSITQSPRDVVNYFDKQFKSEGWKVTNKGGGGSSYGGGAGLRAEKNGTYSKVDAGGENGSDTYFNVWFGSNKNDIDHCDIRD